MYHIKHLKILNFSILSALVLTIIYYGGSIILFGTIIAVESDFFTHSSYMVRDIVNLDFFLPWLGIGVVVFLGTWGLCALIAVIYNAFAKEGKGIKLDLEMLEEKPTE